MKKHLTHQEQYRLISALRIAQDRSSEAAKHLEYLASEGGTPLITSDAAEQIAAERRNQEQEYYDLRCKIENMLWED